MDTVVMCGCDTDYKLVSLFDPAINFSAQIIIYHHQLSLFSGTPSEHRPTGKKLQVTNSRTQVAR